MSESIEARLALLEAKSEIEDLKARYQGHCDENYDPDSISSLFVEDGVWNATGFGRHEGRPAIHAFMTGIGSEITWAWHSVSNGRVEVSDDCESAAGRWYSLVLCTRLGTDGDPRPTIMVGKYTDRIVKEAGVWKFSEIDLVLERETMLSGAWTE